MWFFFQFFQDLSPLCPVEYPIAYNNGKHCCNKFDEFTPGKNLLTLATDSCNAMATKSCNGNCQKCPVQGIITSGVQSIIVTLLLFLLLLQSRGNRKTMYKDNAT